MSERRKSGLERTSGGRPRPLASLDPPAGGPERLERAVRLARCRVALGEELGRHLLAVSLERSRMVLVFDAVRWSDAARANVKRIAPRLGPISGGARLAFDASAGARTHDEAGRAVRSGSDTAARSEGTERERLERLRERFAARAAERRDGGN